MRAKIEQAGNRIELTVGEKVIFYEVEGISMPSLSDFSFAIWHLLPGAIKCGGVVEIDGPVDSKVVENAESISRIWELWQPDQFQEIKVTGTSQSPALPDRKSELVCFSGGIDSTQMLLRLGENRTPAYALTVCGMDYAHDDKQMRFAALLERSAPLLKELNYRQIVLRTNVKQIARGYHSYAMMLAGNTFLFSSLFKHAYFAAERTHEMEFLIFPWGLNHITDNKFVGSQFSLQPLCDDISRAEKCAEIAQNAVALRGLSFCSNHDRRPENCGICRKCLRTKAMFLGMTGLIPDIFLDRSADSHTIDQIDLADRGERTFIIDLVQKARAKGTIRYIASLDRRVKELRRPEKSGLGKIMRIAKRVGLA
jgi:hypothetical protein